MTLVFLLLCKKIECECKLEYRTFKSPIYLFNFILLFTIPPTSSEDGKPVSKKGLKKQAKEAEKEAKKQQRQPGPAAAVAGGDEATAEDCSAGRYGNLPMIQSQNKPDRTLTGVKELTTSRVGQTIWLRGRLYTSRVVGK